MIRRTAPISGLLGRGFVATLVAGVATVAPSGTGSAATASQSGSTTITVGSASALSLVSFDPALGTVTSVEVSLSLDVVVQVGTETVTDAPPIEPVDPALTEDAEATFVSLLEEQGVSIPDPEDVGCWSAYGVFFGGSTDPLDGTTTIESLCYVTNIMSYPYLWRGRLIYRIDGSYIYLLTRYEIVDDGGINGSVP